MLSKEEYRNISDVTHIWSQIGIPLGLLLKKKKKKKKNVSWVESRQSLWYKGCKVRIDSLSDVAEWFKGGPPAHVHWTVESNFAILHYCTILTCPWFPKSTEIKECIPPCDADNPFCYKSFGSYIYKCPYGFNPSLGHKVACFSFFKPYEKKKKEKCLTFTPFWSQRRIPLRLLLKKKHTMGRG